MAEPRYRGRIQMLVMDLAVEDILCLRLKDPSGFYPTVTCREVLYSQLSPADIGRTILSVQAIPPDKLGVPELEAVCRQYRLDSLDPDGQRLIHALARYRVKLLLHCMDLGPPRLVVAGDVEVRRKPSGEFRYWENGYTYQDAYLRHTVSPADG
ncbi:Uncharacterised protein [uncultured Clostridium sp.]|uniref:hypothetical protein n=1 Tax=Intestinimonas butyriciproducens TaxID=1297617 RepID=UPI0008225578|nr:hypothetical protein [Intestinimonas butyriciproducens]SCJ52642.1 Uncharacterised protein [uncultured Clostridium sp.]MBU5230907.1 hypothetical protein [Intestinimonas butyriciproducens]MDB7831155.1 hypothetical protein [Intestinimonas butyriciproducens]MDB7860430.1 hypothetical protein [Intestinimonas butyriciproducens]MDB7863755.1 hypothetical protein [Intestinimonas butyriciproducens]